MLQVKSNYPHGDSGRPRVASAHGLTELSASKWSAGLSLYRHCYDSLLRPDTTWHRSTGTLSVHCVILGALLDSERTTTGRYRREEASGASADFLQLDS